ncbi:MAG: protein-(glutamine-N5) methyltransferase, release factor-specific [Candidatus Moranbacteria bacterium RBG_13_45_13]|nr:MAG: protein-(glutamine-N5) methyltransferase, release factor-specific [Candidatus Moranbacteria bacterium RBG_13_45_13]
MTIADLLCQNTSSRLDAELLLCCALKKPCEYLFAHPEKILEKKQIAEFYKFAVRRAKGEPVAYLTGKKEFFGLDFFVNCDVLIPRPETELLVELVLKQMRCAISDTRYATIIDVGTGSGNIIIAIFKNLSTGARKKVFLYGTDISDSALRVARKNAKRHEAEKKIKFIKSDLLKYFIDKKYFRAGNIIVVANLPYVSSKLYETNQRNLKFEPKTALISENKGLEYYTRLTREIREICAVRRALCVTGLFEISPEQKRLINDIIRKILPEAKIEFFRDLAGKWRVVKITAGKK